MSDNLKKIIALAKADGGKFLVIDEQGQPILVIMAIEQYEKILGKTTRDQSADIEEINKKIIQAQKEDQFTKDKIVQDQLKSEVIDPTFSFENRGAQEYEDF